ncbi:MAG: hypothetical protein JNK14_14730 [Chitinophagaceae bacterium]|nr:hypothetical protein [Chitinophagaceae bacterium]
MRNLIILIIALLPGYTFISCNGYSGPVLVTGSAKPGSYQWTEQTPAAPFSKSYNFQLFTVRDTLWAFHPAGTWYSVNGKDWAKSQLPNSINNLAFLDYAAFGNKILGLGHFEGNINQYSLTTEIYQTTDMRNWSVLAKESNLPVRFFYHPFVFKNKIWIIGGSNGTDSFADVWNSDDGVHWIKRADNMPFGKREGDQFVVFNDRIYMLGNDVWSSDDGLNWKQETKEIVHGESIFGYASLVFDNKIWLLGCNRNGTFKSEILTSSDGKQWKAHRAPWSPRGGIAACIYNGEIFMTGGKYGGPGIDGQTEFIYSNDVWSLRKV